MLLIHVNHYDVVFVLQFYFLLGAQFSFDYL